MRLDAACLQTFPRRDLIKEEVIDAGRGRRDLRCDRTGRSGDRTAAPGRNRRDYLNDFRVGILRSMPSTSIKVPVELRDRLSALARRRHATLAATINHALDVAEAAEFWQQVRDTMPAGSTVNPNEGELDRALSDGLDSDEDWSDVF